MIKKNLIFLLPALALIMLIFMLNTNEPLSTKYIKGHDLYDMTSDSYVPNQKHSKSIIKKNKLISKLSIDTHTRNLRRTTKQQTYAGNLENSGVYNKQNNLKKDDQKTAKKKAKKVAKKNDKKANKKIDKEKKEIAKEDNKNLQDKTTADIGASNDARAIDTNNNESANLSSLSFNLTQSVNADFIDPKELNEDADNGNDNASANVTQNPNFRDAKEEVKSFEVFSEAHFKFLLDEKRFLDFGEVLRSQITASQKKAAYRAALKSLFSKSGDEFLSENSFIRTHFLSHEFADSISSVFQTPGLSDDQTKYSAELLIDLVNTWDVNADDANLFKEVYELSVLRNISSSQSLNDSMLALQDSIEFTSLNILDSGIEVSLN